MEPFKGDQTLLVRLWEMPQACGTSEHLPTRTRCLSALAGFRVGFMGLGAYLDPKSMWKHSLV